MTIGIERRLPTVLLGVAAALLPTFGASGLGVALTLLVASLLVSVVVCGGPDEDRFGPLALIPVGFILLVFVATTVWLVGARLAPDLMGQRGVALLLWWVAMAALVLVGWVKAGRFEAEGSDVASGLAGAATLAIGLAVAALTPFGYWSRLASGGSDFNRHLVVIRDVLRDGGLDYGVQPYPRGLHALVGWLWSASGGVTYADMWRSLESVMWLMVGLIAIAIASIFVRSLGLLGVASRPYAYVGLAFVLFAYLQSAWVTIMFRIGFATSLLAGLVLSSTLALGSAQRGRWLGTPASLAWVAVAIAVLVNGWPILAPTLAMVGIVGLALAVRHRNFHSDRRSWFIALAVLGISVVVSLPPAVAQFQTQPVGEGLATVGFSGLLDPEFWWFVLVALSVGTAVLLWMSNARPWALFTLTMLLVGGATVVYAARSGPGPGAELNYYASKTLWTLSVVVIPLAAATGAWLLSSAIQWASRQPEGMQRTLAFGATISSVVLLTAAVAGRMSGTPSEALVALRQETRVVPITLPVIAELERRGLSGTPAAGDVGAVVWGILPSMTVQDLDTPRPGVTDWLTRESLSWLDLAEVDGGALNGAAIARDVQVVCNYLREHPDAIRITGPNPNAGAPWIIDGGCPVEVVKPEQWISVPIDAAWRENTWLEGRDPDFYPTYDEFQAYLAEQEAKRNQQAPAPSQS